MNTGVSKFHVRDDQIAEIELESGENVIAEQIISTCGVIETESLLPSQYHEESQSEVGNFTILESISVMEGTPKELNWKETVVFFNDSEKFDYICPQDPVDLRSGVICIPENYQSANHSTNFKLRITHPANFPFWSSLSKQQYMNEKEKYEDRILQNGLRYLNGGADNMDGIANRIILRDTFTPKTIKRFTSHENGTLYGSPTKSRDGSTKYKNLFLAGTDQGYIGIVGAMLGGIAVANNQILRPA
jgi:phytoene dehydrogenase-like protein